MNQANRNRESSLPPPATAASGALRVLLADDHTLIRQGLKQVLTDAFGAVRIGEAANARETLTLASAHPWDVILLDITMPGQTGLEVLTQLKQAHPATPVLVLSMHPEDQYAARALKSGASGYLTKNTASELVPTAIRTVLAGKAYVSPSLASDLAQRLAQPHSSALHETLSDREFQILRALGSGRSVKEIAFELSLSAKTVATYRSRILHKLNLDTTAELIRYALREGLAH